MFKKGNINLANKLLSRTWYIDGQVKKGKKIGRKLGYRTCNISLKIIYYQDREFMQLKF